jgi:ABC-2 type transport system permease protein
MISLKVNNLTRTFPGKGKSKAPIIANDKLSFEVKRGEIFGLLGQNGAGKTTLVNQILGLMKPDSGEIWLEGVDVIKQPEQVKFFCGFLPQSGLPMRYLEVERALFFTGCLRGQSEPEAKMQTQELIGLLGLQEYSHRYINRLSGGMLRLVNFAMTLMGRPQILVLDEPTNGLDPANRKLIWETIRRLNQEQGVTCILVTHNVLEAEKVIQRLAVMQRGKIVAVGTPGELKNQFGGKVRLELRLKDEVTLTFVQLAGLKQLGELEQTQPGYYRLHLNNENVIEATALVVRQIGLAQLDDFRLAPPSLEDIYLDIEDSAKEVA